MTDQLTVKEKLDFDYMYGTLFSLSTSIEYLQAIQGIMAERNNKYARNKAREAEATCERVHTVLEREVTKGMSPEEKAISIAAIEVHKQLVYDLFLMDVNDQKRIRNLIDKLKREKN